MKPNLEPARLPVRGSSGAAGEPPRAAAPIPYAGFDASEDRASKAEAMCASHRTIAEHRRRREAARFVPPTASTGKMPFEGHRTVAEWLAC